MDGDVVAVGAVQLHPQVPGHHVAAGRKAGALREGGRAGDQAQGRAGPANNGSVGSPTILHPTAGNNLDFTSKQWLPTVFKQKGISDLCGTWSHFGNPQHLHSEVNCSGWQREEPPTKDGFLVNLPMESAARKDLF